MQDLHETKRNYQADVYLALATVIQGLTLTALGDEVVAALKNPQSPVTIWFIITGLLSLQLSISFWYLFVRDYFFGFRVINLTAQNHAVVASFIFVLGFLQFIAFQFLGDPRLWLTLVLVGIGMVLLNAWYQTGSVEIINVEGVQEALQLDRGSIVFIILVLLATGCLVLWYLVPAINTAFFRTITFGITAAALIQLDASAINAFQKHIEARL